MTDLDDQGRSEPPLTGDETATLLGFLDYQRATLAWKWCGTGRGRPEVVRESVDALTSE